MLSLSAPTVSFPPFRGLNAKHGIICDTRRPEPVWAAAAGEGPGLGAAGDAVRVRRLLAEQKRTEADSLACFRQVR